MRFIWVIAMAIEFKTIVVCPYCGIENRVTIKELEDGYWTPPFLHTCDLESGGCDIEFVVAPKIEVTARIFKIAWDKEWYPHIDEAVCEQSND